MDSLDKKILELFPGKVVRKDLTELMKKGANVPLYVLEYLLGMYCSSDNEEIIKIGMEKIRKVLTENYARSDQSEYIKSKIRENGSYTVIDKISVFLDVTSDKYIASFSNLRIPSFPISSDLVVNNEKLLVGGIWCIIKIDYNKPNENDDEFSDIDILGNRLVKVKKQQKKEKYSTIYTIETLKPIQMPNLSLDLMIENRKNFTKEEWINLILRSVGYEPTNLTSKQQFHYLLRLVPLIQKNYNLVELGPRGTGKSHIYSEVSPYSILISGGVTTAASMFYNVGSRMVGLVGRWDCVALDEVGGLSKTNMETIQILKNYMANGSFGRGTESFHAGASLAFEGNIFRPVEDMIRTTNLFEPFPNSFNNDAAFFDRIHAYLPGWETPKLKSKLFTHHFGLISDCFSEFCHQMRGYDFTNLFNDYFELNSSFNTRDDEAVRKTFSGLAKLIYPDQIMTKEEIKELLIYCISLRRRVKDQLKKMAPSEFKDVNLGFIDLDTNEEFIIKNNEQANEMLINDCFIQPGYVYSIGKSNKGYVGVYCLENKKFSGSGTFIRKNIEGLPLGIKPVYDSINAAFNYFKSNSSKLFNINFEEYDYGLFFNDLQNKGPCDELSVAEVVGLCSCLSGRSVLPSLVIVGKVVVSGSMMPLTTSLNDILICAQNAGAKKILLPLECETKFNELPDSIKGTIIPIFYTTPLDAARKALGI